MHKCQKEVLVAPHLMFMVEFYYRQDTTIHYVISFSNPFTWHLSIVNEIILKI